MNSERSQQNASEHEEDLGSSKVPVCGNVDNSLEDDEDSYLFVKSPDVGIIQQERQDTHLLNQQSFFQKR